MKFYLIFPRIFMFYVHCIVLLRVPKHFGLVQLLCAIKVGFPWDRTSRCPFVPGQGQEQMSRDKTLCPGTSRGTKSTIILHIYAFFRLKIKKKIHKKNLGGPFFGYFLAILSRGTSWDRGSCPGIFPAALFPGQRDRGTRKLICPGTKGQQDVPSRFVPGRPLKTLI